MVRLALFLLFFPLLAFGRVDLLEWRPAGYDYALVIPQVEGETPSQAVERYLGTLEANPELKPFAAQLRAAGQGSAKPLAVSNGPAILGIANDTGDLDAKPDRVQRVLGPLGERGGKTYLAPVAVTAGLKDADAEDFRKQVSDQFDGLVAMGGDDIHPSLYGDADPKRLAVETNLSRDKEEYRLIKYYLWRGRGFFSGICRGHQMGGVASGCALVKDIREELGVEHPRLVDHKIVPVKGSTGPLTRDIFDGNSAISVMSNHHQGVVAPFKPNPRLRVTGVAEGQPGIAEVSEYYGRRGISVQTHPELMPGTSFNERYYNILFGEMENAFARRVSKPFQRVDLAKTLIGVEYTFQDEGMVNEPGRMTFETPHKQARFDAFKSAYFKELGLVAPAEGNVGFPGFKPGNSFEVPGDGKHVMNMEPVTIEVNTPPKKFHEIEAAAEKIFRAADQAKLVPYVNPGAERSGMGHMHVGGATIGDSPFYRHPKLLRNMMAYLHKHPSLLWGMAEAYDIDNFKVAADSNVTNIETYHKPAQQKALAKAIKNFDEWYSAQTMAKQDTSDGLRQFLRFLRAEEGPGVSFFEHYRFMNLEHLAWIPESPTPIGPARAGKFTVEFRNLRPPRTPQHATAHAELLLTMMERQSAPGHLEKMEMITPAEYDRFHSATKVAADWELVKRDLPRYNPLWDDSVGEYVRIQLGTEAVRAALPGVAKAEIYPAFSPKTEKGNKFELRIPVESVEAPRLSYGGQALEFERVQVGGKEYWVSVFDLKRGRLPRLGKKTVTPESCQSWFSVAR
jgi:gamma-glutamyl-gamma-aminobutyrate hydrolase PuuD